MDITPLVFMFGAFFCGFYVGKVYYSCECTCHNKIEEQI